MKTRNSTRVWLVFPRFARSPCALQTRSSPAHFLGTALTGPLMLAALACAPETPADDTTGTSYSDDTESGDSTGSDDATSEEPGDRPLFCDETIDDRDGDGVRDKKDNAPDNYNPEQRDFDGDGIGDVADPCIADPKSTKDKDGDGLGDRCDDDDDVADPRSIPNNHVDLLCRDGYKGAVRGTGLYRVAVDGRCCVTTFPGEGRYDLKNAWEITDRWGETRTYYGCEGFCDPRGIPILRAEHCPRELDARNRVDAYPDGLQCVGMPAELDAESGIHSLYPGCAEALAAANARDPGDPSCEPSRANRPLEPEDIPEDEDPEQYQCYLPLKDQDMDGVSDACDLCPHTWDPSNFPFVDRHGKIWKELGQACVTAEYPGVCED